MKKREKEKSNKKKKNMANAFSAFVVGDLFSRVRGVESRFTNVLVSARFAKYESTSTTTTEKTTETTANLPLTSRDLEGMSTLSYSLYDYVNFILHVKFRCHLNIGNNMFPHSNMTRNRG